MRKICYISGTRADYGLMRSVLKRLHDAIDVDLSICVTGMHLSSLYGSTVEEIKNDGFTICAEIPVDVTTCDNASMAKSIGYELIGFTEVLEQQRPDIVLLLGDRGEMLAGALAALHLNIPIVHLHGGERSGTVDEMVRHAISKLSHYHFVATNEAAHRLIRMGEKEECIFVVGAPGLDEINSYLPASLEQVCTTYNLSASKPFALMVFHPVVQEITDLRNQFSNTLKAALALDLQVILLEPNSDAGRQLIQLELNEYLAHPEINVIKHMQRNDYLDCLANAAVMIGNSSSGIIEACSYNLPVVNVGTRQQLRERSNNVVDVTTDYEAILHGLTHALNQDTRQFQNVYGDGQTSERCYKLLTSINISSTLLNKYNVY